MKIERDPNNGALSFKLDEETDSSSVNLSQQRIASLIKNLHSKGVPAEGCIDNLPAEIINQSSEIPMATDHVTDISQLEKEVDASIIEGDIRVPIELQGVEIQGDDTGQTFIAITDLADTLGVTEKDIAGQVQAVLNFFV